MTSPGSLRLLSCAVFVAVALAGFAQNPSTAPGPVGDLSSARPKPAIRYGDLPLSFEPNLGQTAREVQWLARGPQYTLFLAGHDAVLELNAITPSRVRGVAPKIDQSAVRMNLLGAEAGSPATGEKPQSGRANYFTGKDPSKWQRNVPMYGRVRLNAIYAGIDLVYYGRQGQLEYDFAVAPGADPSSIRWGFDGAKPQLAANGDLLLPVINAKGGAGDEIRLNKPVVYQMKDGLCQTVDGSFAITKNGEASFKLGTYDKSRELIIDPTLTFLGALGTGGQGQTVANGMAVDSAGEIILTGVTQDANFPVTKGALQTTCNTDAPADKNLPYTRCNNSQASSAFVSKISADGTSLVFSTYLHGLSGNESGADVAVDSSGNAVILGATSSNDFPVTTTGTTGVEPAYQSVCQPYYNGTSIVPICNGFFNGGGTEYTVNGPVMFIAKLKPDGSELLYSTFFGGTAAVYPVALALDSSDNMYFSGWVQAAWPTGSIYPNNGNQNIQFPVTSGAYQTVGLNGSQAGSLSVLSADGQTLLYSTFMSSLNSAANSSWAEPLAIAVGQNGIAAIGGVTLASSFPTTPGSVRPSCVVNPSSTNDCYGYTGWVSVFDTTQSGDASLVYSTFIGGDEVQSNNTENQVQGLAFDSSNDLFVTGFTTLSTYPTTRGVYQPSCVPHCDGEQHAILSKIDPTGSTYLWSTLYGETRGGSQTYGNAIAFDQRGWVYLYGYNNGYAWDLPVVNPLEALDGNNFAFVAVFSGDGKQLIFSTPVAEAPSNPVWSDESINNHGVAVDSSGNIYVGAQGNDGGNIVTTTGAYATTAASNNYRTYFAKISKVLGPVATKLTISPSPALPGTSITFIASVTGTAGDTPRPTGTVTLTNGNTSPATKLGTITLGGSATGSFSTSKLARGSYSVTATYSGDNNYETGASAAQTLSINQLAPRVTLKPASTAIKRIAALKVAVAVGLAGYPTPTGSVILAGGGYTSPAAKLSGGKATIDIPANKLNDGSDVLTATYTPAASSSATYRTATGKTSVDVSRTRQTIDFIKPPSPVVFGVKPIKLNAKATSGLKVTFSILSGHAKVSGDLLTITGVGNVVVAANQLGNLSYARAPQVTKTIVVEKAP